MFNNVKYTKANRRMKTYKDILENINNGISDLYFIHYSCQSLSDDNEGYSPRITSIAVLHSESYQMFSFSIHLVAERLKINRDLIFDRYEEIELKMLQDFFDFVSERIDKAIWVHWNMSNINFGFEALEHRYTVLSGNPCNHISENNKHNLSNIIKLKYGPKYAKDPKMKYLMVLNNILHRDFLNGEEEVTAFKAKEFIKLHKSTMCKVYFFNEVYNRIMSNKLKTETNRLRYKINEIYQSPIVQIITMVGTIGTIISLIVFFFI